MCQSDGETDGQTDGHQTTAKAAPELTIGHIK